MAWKILKQQLNFSGRDYWLKDLYHEQQGRELMNCHIGLVLLSNSLLVRKHITPQIESSLPAQPTPSLLLFFDI